MLLFLVQCYWYDLKSQAFEQSTHDTQITQKVICSGRKQNKKILSKLRTDAKHHFQALFSLERGKSTGLDIEQSSFNAN